MRKYFKPCWSCGAQYRTCFEGCQCEKCVDPEGYEQWKRAEPEEYEDWLESQRENDESDEDDFYPDAPY